MCRLVQLLQRTLYADPGAAPTEKPTAMKFPSGCCAIPRASYWSWSARWSATRRSSARRTTWLEQSLAEQWLCRSLPRPPFA
eukprot:2146820-Pyramimonas_sp.AAC.1